MNKVAITAIVVVYNEEKRISDLLKMCRSFDQVIVIDKESTDATVSLAIQFDCEVLHVPFSITGDEGRFGIEIARNEWVFFLTASECFNFEFVQRLHRVLTEIEDSYDAVEFPIAHYINGIHERFSPWYGERRVALIKKSRILLTKYVHKEVQFRAARVYKYSLQADEFLAHLTHENIRGSMERFLRYCSVEPEKYRTERFAMRETKREMLSALKRTLLGGKMFHGGRSLYLSILYLVYFQMKFLFVWQKFNPSGEEIYPKIREEAISSWKEERTGN